VLFLFIPLFKRKTFIVNTLRLIPAGIISLVYLIS